MSAQDYLEMVRARDELNQKIADTRKQAYQAWFNKMMDEAAEHGFTVQEIHVSVKKRMPRK